MPHRPSVWDLESLGHGQPGAPDETRNGVLLLDECATWLNSRTFASDDRRAFIDWAVHSRKLGWDVYFIVQNSGVIDKQLRLALIEYEVRMRRTDRIKVPIIGHVLNGVFGGRVGYFPRAHLATTTLPDTNPRIAVDRDIFRGDDLNDCYDTREVFTETDDFGPHSSLKRSPPPPVPLLARLAPSIFGQVQRPPLKPKPPAVAALAALPCRDAAWSRARELASA